MHLSPYSFSEEVLLNLTRKSKIFNEITSDFPLDLVRDLWAKELDQKSYTDSSYTYGEVDFLSLAETFEIINTRHSPIPPGGVFYDLGSGSGKGVLSAALLHPFSICKGVEILDSLYSISQSLYTSYQQMRLHLIYSYPDLWSSLPDIELIHSDMFDCDWSDASFIFINSTCFDSEMMEKISKAEVRPGTWAVTLTKSLKSPNWQIKQSLRKPMSWGEATIIIHQKI